MTREPERRGCYQSKKLSAANIAMALSLRAEGLSISAIAERFHCAAMTIRRAIREQEKP